MKKFNEYTKSEKENIIRKGGDKKRELEKACLDWLDTLDLPEDVADIVHSTSPILELYGTCETIEDVIELSRL